MTTMTTTRLSKHPITLVKDNRQKPKSNVFSTNHTHTHIHAL